MKLYELPQDINRAVLYILAALAFIACLTFIGTLIGIVWAPYFALLGVGLVVLGNRVGHAHHQRRHAPPAT
ncbi:hypothetical protein NGB36_25635 [Streptomyces sp. RB6PN25]|uniref:Uncharacterized protein n=1 Tax=Streptomyces humicola TaxID=2953240 RepID=A0ABT1Q1S1_9ACTN|nr:hypothetical protein [Streptomyces humicola]MCQ4083879.1 hypothetical protein [Streptomyces humicola]